MAVGNMIFTKAKTKAYVVEMSSDVRDDAVKVNKKYDDKELACTKVEVEECNSAVDSLVRESMSEEICVNVDNKKVAEEMKAKRRPGKQSSGRGRGSVKRKMGNSGAGGMLTLDFTPPGGMGNENGGYVGPHTVYEDLSPTTKYSPDEALSFIPALSASVIGQQFPKCAEKRDPSQDIEWQKLIEMLRGLGIHRTDKMANPFGEDYYLSRDFMTAVYERFLDVNMDKDHDSPDYKTLRQVEMKYRLEELKSRAASEEANCLLVGLMTREFDWYVYFVFKAQVVPEYNTYYYYYVCELIFSRLKS